jgi:hypothetical protein
MLKWWASVKRALFAAMGNGRQALAAVVVLEEGNLVTPTGLVLLRLIATVIGARALVRRD